jgi:PAS domain S-box-containing protein
MTTDIDAQLEQQKTALLYRNVGLAQSVNVFNATLLAYANVAMHVSALWAFLWWLVFVVTAGFRYQLARRFQKARPDAKAAPQWRTRYFIGTIIGALIWSIGGVLFMWRAPEGSMLLTGLVISGTIAGAIPVLAPVPVVFRTFTLLVSIPMTACVLLQANSPLLWAFGLMTIAFIAALLLSGGYLHETLTVAIRLSLEQGKLIINLEQANHTAVAAIAERDQLIQRLKAEQDFLQVLTNSLPGTFFALNTAQRFVRWNSNFEQVTGLGEASIRQLDPLDLFVREDRTLISDALVQAFKEGKASVEATVRIWDDSLHPYLITLQRMTFNGEILLIGVGLDVTSVKTMESELLNHRDHLEELVTQRTTDLAKAKAAAEEALSLVEATLEATDNGLLVVNLGGKIVRANQRFAQMWKVPQALIEAGDDSAVVNHVLVQFDDPQRFLSKVQALYDKPDATSRDTLRFSDGRVFARFSHPQRISGEIVGRVWSFLDITEQHQAEQRVLQLSQAITEELEHSERQRGQLQTLLASIPDLVWMKDPEGVFLSANPAFGVLLGAAPEHILGKTDYDFFPPALAAQFRADDLEASNSALPVVREEWVTYLNDGHVGLLETIKNAVRGKNGQLVGVLGIARDVTKARSLLEDLKKARIEAQNSSEAKSSFLASMSHELRTPLNAIIGFAQMLDMGVPLPLAPAQKEPVRHILDSGRHLLGLINEVLDLTRIEAGKLFLSIAIIDIAPLIEGVINLTQAAAHARRITLHHTCPKGMHVRADAARVRQILTNLLSNAIKYNREDGMVVVSCQQKKDVVLISVSDTGGGITMEQQAKLFQPFQRLGAEQTVIEGTGIGLVICKKLAEAMDGRIGVDSRIGTGCSRTTGDRSCERPRQFARPCHLCGGFTRQCFRDEAYFQPIFRH